MPFGFNKRKKETGENSKVEQAKSFLAKYVGALNITPRQDGTLDIILGEGMLDRVIYGYEDGVDDKRRNEVVRRVFETLRRPFMVHTTTKTPYGPYGSSYSEVNKGQLVEDGTLTSKIVYPSDIANLVASANELKPEQIAQITDEMLATESIAAIQTIRRIADGMEQALVDAGLIKPAKSDDPTYQSYIGDDDSQAIINPDDLQ